MLSLEKRRFQGDLTVPLQYMKGACKKDGEKLLTRMCSDRTKGNDITLKEARFRLGIRRKFLAVSVMRH